VAASADAGALACAPFANPPYKSGSNLYGVGGHSGCSSTSTAKVFLKKDNSTWPDQIMASSSGQGSKVTLTEITASPAAGRYYIEALTVGGSKVQSTRYQWK
jgi:hypothetical protein